MKRHLTFSLKQAKNKPNTIKNKTIPCPFCDFDTLKTTNHVLVEKEKMYLIENKFPTLENSYQTVFIETDSCKENLSNYPKETLYQVLSFGLKQWQIMLQNPAYASVLFFKNHGEFANASIQHAHMQIIGLKEINYQLLMRPEQFNGPIMYQDDSVEWNVSSAPKNEAVEFNIKIKKEAVLSSLNEERNASFEMFCQLIQLNVQYLLEHVCSKSGSFNLAFYEADEDIIVKLIPRNPDGKGFYSVIFLGYDISPVPDSLSTITEDIKRNYLPSLGQSNCGD